MLFDQLMALSGEAVLPGAVPGADLAQLADGVAQEPVLCLQPIRTLNESVVAESMLAVFGRADGKGIEEAWLISGGAQGAVLYVKSRADLGRWHPCATGQKEKLDLRSVVHFAKENANQARPE